MPERMSEYMAERMPGSMWRAQSKMSENARYIPDGISETISE